MFCKTCDTELDGDVGVVCAYPECPYKKESLSETLESVAPVTEPNSYQEPPAPTRAPRKLKADMQMLRKLGWSNSQLNKLDRATAAQYAAEARKPPPKYSRGINV